MKKTFTINISGIIFHIDDDAYEMLQNYLNSITGKFSDEEEGKEIIADVEARIAELFQERISDSKQVITIGDVNAVIEIMGKPEDFAGEDVEEEKEKEEKQGSYKPGKRIFRDPDDTIFGGVCGGLGAYFGMDPLVFRIIFVVLAFAFGTGFWIYIIMWALVPKATTTAEKLEMRGERVNVNNIEKSIRDEINNVKDNIKNIKKNRRYQNGRNFFEHFFSHMGEGFQSALKIFAIFVGIGLVMFGLFFLVSFISSYFFEESIFSFASWSSHTHSVSTLLGSMVSNSSVNLIFIGLFFVFGIPLAALIYGGIKLIFRIQTNSKAVGISFFVAWMVGFVILLIVGLSEGRNFRNKGKDIETYEITDIHSDTLYVSMSPDTLDEDYISVCPHSLNILDYGDEHKLIGQPEFTVIMSENDQYELVVKKRARGRNRKHAEGNTETILYKWDQQGNKLVLDPYFELLKGSKWRSQSVDLILKVPFGKSVFFEQGVDELFDDVPNKNNVFDEDMTNKMWQMGPDGLCLMLDTARF